MLEREAVPGGRAGRLGARRLPVRHRPDRADDAGAHRRLAGLRRRAAGGLAASWSRSTRSTGRTTRTASTLDVHADVEAMAAEIARVCGAAEAAGYRRYVDWVSALYRLEMRDFIDRNLDSPLDLLGPTWPGWSRLRGFGRLAPAVARHLKDPRTQRVFSFQAMYAGLSPYEALALYAVIAYMDSRRRGVVPAGWRDARGARGDGRRRGQKHGVRVPVRDAGRPGRDRRRPGPVRAHRRRRARRVRRGRPHPRPAGRVPDLLPPGAAPRRIGRLRYSPSCWLLLAGSTAATPRSRTTTSTSAGPGGACSTRSSGTAGSCATRRCW